MKAKYYKGIGATAIACMLFFSSCLKDNGYINFAGVGTLIEMPMGGFINFSNDALTESHDTIVRTIAVNIASPNPLKTPLTVTIGFSQADLTAYNAANPAINYLPFPTGSYVLPPTTVTIPAGQRLVEVPITFYKSMLDPSKSYMLPLAILSTDNPAVTINATYPAHYYHFIGNPFAGSYTWNFYRYNNYTTSNPPPPGTAPSGGSFFGANAGTVTFGPVSPTQFEVTSGYYTAKEHYEVTFTQVDATHFSNFQISMNAADVLNIFTANGITLNQQPVFGYGITPAYDPNAVLTYAQALSYFTFQYTVNTGHDRFLVDNYVHN